MFKWYRHHHIFYSMTHCFFFNINNYSNSTQYNYFKLLFYGLHSAPIEVIYFCILLLLFLPQWDTVLCTLHVPLIIRARLHCCSSVHRTEGLTTLGASLVLGKDSTSLVSPLAAKASSQPRRYPGLTTKLNLGPVLLNTCSLPFQQNDVLELS